MPLRLTSLLLVEERLLEASYFADRMSEQRGGDELGYNLNAFLSASRAVTFLLQKEMRHVDGFEEWWSARQDEMRVDRAMRFFHQLRNFSQKEGRVAIVSMGSSQEPSSWRHQFVDGRMIVPVEVRQIDAVDACRVYLARVAKTVLACMDRFPYQTCPARALTPKGVEALSIDLDDVDEAIGLERGFTGLDGNYELSDRIRILQRSVDAVDRAAIEELAAVEPTRPLRPTVEDGFLAALVQRWIMRSGASPSGPQQDAEGEGQ